MLATEELRSGLPLESPLADTNASEMLPERNLKRWLRQSRRASNLAGENPGVPKGEAGMNSTSSAESETQVVLLKKSQGSVWTEVGRTSLCPTVRWLAERFGEGQYEMRLRHGNRVLCMANAEAVHEEGGPAHMGSRPGLSVPSGEQLNLPGT